MKGATVTVTRCGRRRVNARYRLAFSALPDRSFGPFEFADACQDLRVSALLTPLEARDLVLSAHTEGSATAAIASA